MEGLLEEAAQDGPPMSCRLFHSRCVVKRWRGMMLEEESDGRTKER